LVCEWVRGIAASPVRIGRAASAEPELQIAAPASTSKAKVQPVDQSRRAHGSAR